MNKKIIISVLSFLLAVFSVVSIITASAGSFVEYNDWMLEIPSATNKTEYYINSYNGNETKIVIPEEILDHTIVKINEYAFANNSELLYCTIPDTVIEIDNYAFDSCTGLREIKIPASVAKLGKGVFYGCNSIVDVNIAANSQLDTIPYVCFGNCTSMLTATVGQGVDSISDYAFGNCSNLRYITIYPSVTEIGANAFYNCEHLTIRGFSGSYALQFAVENNIPYVNLGAYVEPTEPAPTASTEPSEIITTVVTAPVTTAVTPSTAVTEPTETSVSATASEPTETTVVFKLLYFMGDADLDYRVTIKDATKIQKHLANITLLDETQLILADVDENSNVTIKDATKIQKYLAGFENISVVGSEVYL